MAATLVDGWVAWTMFDGNIMVGRVVQDLFSRTEVARVDGTRCTVEPEKLRPATQDDFDSAVRFFKTLGR